MVSYVCGLSLLLATKLSYRHRSFQMFHLTQNHGCTSQLHLSDVNFQWVKIREVVTDLQIQTLWNIAVMKAVLLSQMLLRHPLLEPLLCSQAVNLLLQLSICCSVYKLWCLWFVLSCSIVMVWTGVRSWTLREEPSWPPSWRITATNWRAGPAAPCWLDPSTWNWGEERDSDSVCKRRG